MLGEIAPDATRVRTTMPCERYRRNDGTCGGKSAATRCQGTIDPRAAAVSNVRRMRQGNAGKRGRLGQGNDRGSTRQGARHATRQGLVTCARYLEIECWRGVGRIVTSSWR